MPSKKGNMLVFNQHMKSDKMPCIIYASIESLLVKKDGCLNNPEIPSTTKLGEHVPCGCSMPTIWAFGNIENKHTFYRGEDCIKKFCTSIRESVTNAIDLHRKKMLLVTK